MYNENKTQVSAETDKVFEPQLAAAIQRLHNEVTEISSVFDNVTDKVGKIASYPPEKGETASPMPTPNSVLSDLDAVGSRLSYLRERVYKVNNHLNNLIG